MSKAATSMPGLVLDNVTLRLDGVVLVNINCRIKPGEVLTIMGESGSGKSTLLDYLSGFLKPDFEASGRVILDGTEITDLPPQDRQVGLMFQSPLLFAHMSVEQNLMFAIPAETRGRASRRALAHRSLDEVGLAGFGHRDPATLSGGQQTRIALVRLLLAQPKTLLLDEPFSSLDQERRADIRKLVFAKARERALPVLLVTHDPEDAAAAGGQVVHL